MITNQLMLRKMGDFDVYQRTEDSFFNATSLLEQWCKSNNSKKNINHFLELSSTKEFINEIIRRDTDIRKSERPENQIVRRTKCITFKDGSKKAGSYWFCPFLFIDFAMWINPSFKYDVLKFVYDKMIDYRNKAGDAYKTLATNVQKLVGSNFMPIAMRRIGEAINWIIFNCHEKDLRNKFGSEEKQNELYQFEIKVATLIDEGFITNYDDLIKYLRNQYARRYKPF